MTASLSYGESQNLGLGPTRPMRHHIQGNRMNSEERPAGEDGVRDGGHLDEAAVLQGHLRAGRRPCQRTPVACTASSPSAPARRRTPAARAATDRNPPARGRLYICSRAADTTAGPRWRWAPPRATRSLVAVALRAREPGRERRRRRVVALLINNKEYIQSLLKRM